MRRVHRSYFRALHSLMVTCESGRSHEGRSDLQVTAEDRQQQNLELPYAALKTSAEEVMKRLDEAADRPGAVTHGGGTGTTRFVRENLGIITLEVMRAFLTEFVGKELE